MVQRLLLWLLLLQVLQLLAENTPDPAQSHFGSFYSSELGGIVTEPGFMVVSIDDRMVNKGDAVYETVMLSEGYLYQLDDRLQRFMDSADLAGIPLPFSEERLRRILLDTAAASLKMNGECASHAHTSASFICWYSFPYRNSSGRVVCCLAVSAQRWLPGRPQGCLLSSVAAHGACRHVDVLAVARPWQHGRWPDHRQHLICPP
jgi:hypothetical protein